LLVGQVGAGKSSFFNTINSIFRGYITSQACSGNAEHSLTTVVSKKYFIFIWMIDFIFHISSLLNFGLVFFLCSPVLVHTSGISFTVYILFNFQLLQELKRNIEQYKPLKELNVDQ
jgi:hypothetical protein